MVASLHLLRAKILNVHQRRSNDQPQLRCPILRAVLVCTALCIFGFTQTTYAQIYGGVNASGTIVLSSTATAEASDVLVAAPPPTPSEKMSQPGSGTLKPNQWVNRADVKALDPLILASSQTHRVPASLIRAVIAIESNFNPNAVSPKGARGLMQLMPATAKRFGAKNSFDPHDNISAGAKYLRWLLDAFGNDMSLALAAYNAGENAVLRAGNKIPNYSETMQYVPKVLTAYQGFPAQ
jgi:soluble lytic murein transglycosylase-like protein